MPDLARGYEIEQLDAADLDNAMAFLRVKAGCFRIKRDFSHALILSICFSAFNVKLRPIPV